MTHLPKSELVGVLAPYSINTRDVGVNWQTVIYNIGGAVPSSSMYLGNGIAIVTGPNSVYRSTDYGKNWFVITSGLSLSVPIRTSVYIENGIAIIGAGLRIHRTTDFGVTWTDLGAFANAISSSAYLGNGIVIIGILNGSIRRSIDYGATWSAEIPVAAGIIQSVVYLENGIVLLADSLGNVWRSTNFGVAWSNITNLGVFSTGNNLVYLGNGIVVAGTTSNIWRSIDFGLTWQVVNAFGNIYHGTIYLGNGIVIAVSEFNGGIVGDTARSTDFGLTWTNLGNISAGSNIKTVTYLSNGIAISVDNAGNINRSNVSYKIDEAQVNYPRIPFTPVRLFDTTYTNTDPTRSLLIMVSGECAVPAGGLAAFDIRTDTASPPVTIVALAGIIANGTLNGDSFVFQLTAVIRPGFNYRIVTSAFFGGLVTKFYWIEVFI